MKQTSLLVVRRIVSAVPAAGLLIMIALVLFAVFGSFEQQLIKLTAVIGAFVAGFTGLFVWQRRVYARADAMLEQKVQERTEELAKSNASTTEFLHICSHQLLSPLYKMQLALKMVYDQIHKMFDKDQESLMEAALMNTTLLADTVNLMRTFSHLERGIMETKMTPVPVCEVLEEIKLQHVMSLREKHQHLTVSSCVNVALQTDKKILREILSILISNAIRYSRDGGDIILASEVMYDSIRFDIIDTGCGIPEEDIPHLFDKFFRSKNAIEAAPEGSGIGLYLAASLAKVIGGKLSVKSEINKGSTFSLTVKRNVEGIDK